MSVQCNQYIGYGYMMEYDDVHDFFQKHGGADYWEDQICDTYHDSAFDDKIKEVYGCSMIIDGMDGKYVFFGKLYAKSKNHSALDSMEIPTPTERDRIITEHEFRRVFEGFEPCEWLEPKLHYIAHYR